MARKTINVIVVCAAIAWCLVLAEQQQQQQLDSGSKDDQYDDNGWEDSVPGLAGRDYPNLTSIPETSFTCVGKTPGGYYADVETRCQVFHVCSTQGSKSSFLCPSGSIFNQRHFVCDWWYDFVCDHALDLYSLNDALNDRTGPEPQRTRNRATSPSPPQATSTTERSRDHQDRYSLAPLQSNSLSGGNHDLSLASSGYTNNLRDEANLIYEDYVPLKTSDSTKEKEKSSSGNNGNLIVSGVRKAGELRTGSFDNYSDGRRKDSTYSGNDAGRFNGQNSFQQQQSTTTTEARSHNYGNVRQTTYRSRTAQDITPRGFSKDNNEELAHAEARGFVRNRDGPAFFVNNGLSENGKNQNNLVQGSSKSDNSNNKYSSKAYDTFNAKVTTRAYSTVKFENQYQSTEKINPLPQENNYYRDVYKKENNNNNVKNNENNNKNNNNDFYKNHNYNNNFDNNNQNYNNYDNKNKNNYNNNKNNVDVTVENRKYENNHDTSSTYANHNYGNQKDVTISKSYYDKSRNDNYYRKINIYASNNNNAVKTTKPYQQTTEPYDKANIIYNEDTFDPTLEEGTTTPPDFVFSNPTDDEADRQRQRTIDMIDFKRIRNGQRQQQQQEYSTPSFLIREESAHFYQHDRDLSTSSSGSHQQQNQQQTQQNRQQQQTQQLQQQQLNQQQRQLNQQQQQQNAQQQLNNQQAQQRQQLQQQQQNHQFLGRRPAGGLPGGSGSGVPGVKKTLVSDTITGKPSSAASFNKIPAGPSEKPTTVSAYTEQPSTARTYDPDNYDDDDEDLNEFGPDGLNWNHRWDSARQ
ncbi:bromodomain-containing protein DDB_G0280777-like [Trichogramma pretiosum]|uniref:bromodomain-containing protein DDB_G0280777-like n=1 Tax=Trichogramma pretiosum TaxID=7493 RepID=UPI0006C9D625|nr:bromodomain-containing protein DDB_G0280777-like [Trichogramma pretiosum]